MTDRYENIRRALAMLGPGNSTQEQIAAIDDLDHACDPDTIRELLAERDALAAALEAARENAERLDALEALVKESSERALLLHHGWHKPREPSFCGLGLGNTGRTLRQAIDQARGKEDGNG